MSEGRFTGILRRLGRKQPKPRLTPEEQAYLETPEGRATLREYFSTPEGADELRRALKEEINRKQPPLRRALWADACIYSSQLMGPPAFNTKLGFVAEAWRMSWATDAYFCMVLYRVRTRLIVLGVPVLPAILHRMCMMISQISIGSGVVIQPGVYIPHGQVVIDGMIEIGNGTIIAPWVTLGRYGEPLEGPSIGREVFIGTGAKLFGPIKIGDGARIGANAVVVTDVAPNTTVVGAPAKPVRDRQGDGSSQQAQNTGNREDGAADD